MKIWAKTKEWCEGKFLVLRRDGTSPAWPHFVLGARDPWAPEALRAYAVHAWIGGADPEYCRSIMELADDFTKYRAAHGNGDPEAGPHRKDDPDVIAAMRGISITIQVRPDKRPAGQIGGTKALSDVPDRDELAQLLGKQDGIFASEALNVLDALPRLGFRVVRSDGGA